MNRPVDSQSLPTAALIGEIKPIAKYRDQYRDRIPGLLIDSATLILLIGMIGNIAANSTHWSSGSFTSLYTVSALVAALLVNVIRHFSRHALNLAAVGLELATLFFLALVLSNPIRWGLPAIMMMLAAWVIISGLHYLLTKPYTWRTVLPSLIILVVTATLLNAHMDDVVPYSGQVHITDVNLFPFHGPAFVILCGWVCAEGIAALLINTKYRFRGRSQ